jgi:hypothetical protein
VPVTGTEVDPLIGSATEGFSEGAGDCFGAKKKNHSIAPTTISAMSERIVIMSLFMVIN